MGEAPVSQLGLSWSLTLPQRVSLSLSVERGIGGNEEYRQGRAAYMTVGIPLGGQGRLRGYVRSDERSGVRQGLAVSAAVSETLAYTVNAEHRDNASAAVAARINALPRYTSLDVGLGQRAGATEYDLGLRGGVLLHRDGVTLSPYALRDTVGVLKAGERSGVRLQTPQGPVWTDGAGRAVAANLPAYSLARLEVDPLGLPRNVEVLDGVQEVTAGRGSVQHLDFSLVTVRRLLLKARLQDRQWLPRGLSVLDAQGEYLTSVMDAGTIFLPDIQPGQVLRVKLSDSSHCVLHFPLSESPGEATQIETVEAICRPSNLS
jgi:outer membrane usher protein FimD/PapC